MIRSLTHNRRGVALLVVLGVLLVTSSAMLVLVQVASTSVLQRRHANESRNADAALRATDIIINDWLRNESSSVVLPADAVAPAVGVLHNELVIDGSLIRIYVTAWDQLGMAPLSLTQQGSLLRLAVPTGILRQVDGIEIPSNIPAGLDLLSPSSGEPGGVFPKHHPMELAQFADSNGSFDSRFNADRSIDSAPSADTDQIELGAFIATHNPSPGVINVNTAPFPLIRQALLAAGRGGMDMIEQRRRDGSPVVLGDLPDQVARSRKAATVQLVGTSSVWSFRVDVSWGFTHRCWWMVYQRTGSQWECVQRLVIDE